MKKYVIVLIGLILLNISCNKKPELKENNYNSSFLYINYVRPEDENLPIIKASLNKPILIKRPCLVEFTVNDCSVGIIGISSEKVEIQTLFPSLAYSFKNNGNYFYLNQFLLKNLKKTLKLRVLPKHSPVKLEISTDKNYTVVDCTPFKLTPVFDSNIKFVFIIAPNFQIKITSPSGQEIAKENEYAGIIPAFHDKRYVFEFLPTKNCKKSKNNYISIIKFHIGKQI